MSLRRNSFAREASRELQRIALVRYVQSGIVPSAVADQNIADDDGHMVEEAQELLADYLNYHPKIKKRWQDGLGGGDDLDGLLMPLAIKQLRTVSYMIRAGQRTA